MGDWPLLALAGLVVALAVLKGRRWVTIKAH
jgi:hypothetical protein